MNPSRRTFLKAGLGMSAAFLLPSGDLCAQAAPLLQKKIPSSGESIPIIGLGTARRYEDISTEAEKAPLIETIRQFKQLGARVIDTSASYGTAEAVVGEIVERLKIRNSLFLATKVSLRNGGREAGLAQVEQSFKKSPCRHDRSHRGAQFARYPDPAPLAPGDEASGPHPLRRDHHILREPVPGIRADHEKGNSRLHPGRLCAR